MIDPNKLWHKRYCHVVWGQEVKFVCRDRRLDKNIATEYKDRHDRYVSQLSYLWHLHIPSCVKSYTDALRMVRKRFRTFHNNYAAFTQKV